MLIDKHTNSSNSHNEYKTTTKLPNVEHKTLNETICLEIMHKSLNVKLQKARTLHDNNRSASFMAWKGKGREETLALSYEGKEDA